MADIISGDLNEIKKWGAKIKALAYEYSYPSDLIDYDDANNFFEEILIISAHKNTRFVNMETRYRTRQKVVDYHI